MIRKKFSCLAAVCAVLSFSAAPAAAQACVGLPLKVGQSVGYFAAGFPDGSKNLALGVDRRFTEALTFDLSYTLVSPDGGNNVHLVGAGGSVSLPLDLPVNVCAWGSVRTNLNDALPAILGVDVPSGVDYSDRLIQAPLGIMIGGTLDMENGFALVPFAGPQFMWQRFSLSLDGESATESDSDFGFGGGMNLLVSNLIFGFGVSHISDTAFGLTAGILF
jgi:hypothetical protein